jgi:hypothetical protein
VINPKAYDDVIEQIRADMERSRNLGLFRTAEKLHAALSEARSERFEAQPTGVATIKWKIGPVREQ